MSHPAWVCGLKHAKELLPIMPVVTPCVGVWIETVLRPIFKWSAQSHPAWVCGLKQKGYKVIKTVLCHTLRGCVD